MGAKRWERRGAQVADKMRVRVDRAAPVYLVGGGWDERAHPLTYRPFAAAASRCGRTQVACILHDIPDREVAYGFAAAALGRAGVDETFPVFVSQDRPLRLADLNEATGILVGGGLTPAYHDAIVPESGEWLPWLRDNAIPYAGYSAGAMIAPVRAIIGGWKLRRGDHTLVICSEDVSEDEELLDIRPGLGLVNFAVDVHASQYGTPTRLMHAVHTRAVEEGWAIDEETMLEATAGAVTVYGLGSAYRVRPAVDGLEVIIASSGETRAQSQG